MAVAQVKPMQRRSRDDEAVARVFGKRAALGLCIAVSLWFIGASVSQIIPAVFGAGIVPIAPGGEGSPERECAEGLRAGGSPQAPTGGTGGPAGPEALARACGQASAGMDGLAALERLRVAQDQLKGSDPATVERLRRELSAHLPAEMR